MCKSSDTSCWNASSPPGCFPGEPLLAVAAVTGLRNPTPRIDPHEQRDHRRARQACARQPTTSAQRDRRPSSPPPSTRGFKSRPVSRALFQPGQFAGEKQRESAVKVQTICPSCRQHVDAAVDEALARLSHRQVAHTRCPGCGGYIDIPLPRPPVTRRQPAPTDTGEDLPPGPACRRCGGPADLVEPRRGAPYLICRRRCGSHPNNTSRKETS